MAPVIDAVIPARDEASTVADAVRAALGCRYVRNVIVVDDGSGDLTALRAEDAGAHTVVRRPVGGSKAHAMKTGVDATDADAILFCDADLVGITSAHLDEVCRPFVEGAAVMSLGTFDYGLLNSLVLRLPPTSGERVVPRWVFESIPAGRLDGYTIEVMINEVVAEAHLPTSARVMRGVTHRTKRQKFGLLEGYRRTWEMFWQLVNLPARYGVRWRTYAFYLRGLHVERVR
jgi:glycosyltransferase involved in cell wall biosynthesis